MKNLNDDDLSWLAEAERLGYNSELEQLRLEIEMKSRKDILKNHKFAITQSIEHNKDREVVRWRTMLPDANGKATKQLKKSTREALEDAIVEYYRTHEKDNVPKFDDVYHEWAAYHHNKNNSSNNTIDKYKTDYFRFIKPSKIAQMYITDITDTMLEDYFIDAIKSYVGLHGEKGLQYKPFTKLYGYIEGVFRYAFRRRIIKENPMLYLDKTEFKNTCRQPKTKTADTELIPNDAFDKLLNQLYKDMEEQPDNFTFYAVEFSALTGMRVGEVATLKWEDINYERRQIYISRSDKYNKERDDEGKVTKRYWTIEGTKTKQDRWFPIDDYIMRSLERIKKAQEDYDCKSEFLFPHPEYGWCISYLISSCMRNKCKQVGMARSYGIHALRKTLNSDMRNNNAPAKLCSTIIGNTEAVNDRYYYYDNSTVEEQRKFVESAHKKRAYA